jgi:hypothetical protein
VLVVGTVTTESMRDPFPLDVEVPRFGWQLHATVRAMGKPQRMLHPAPVILAELLVRSRLVKARQYATAEVCASAVAEPSERCRRAGPGSVAMTRLAGRKCHARGVSESRIDWTS